jgi:hypothetical protein
MTIPLVSSQALTAENRNKNKGKDGFAFGYYRPNGHNILTPYDSGGACAKHPTVQSQTQNTKASNPVPKIPGTGRDPVRGPLG